MKAAYAKLVGTLCAVALVVPAVIAQGLQTLHITVSIADAAQQDVPMARYALLISEDPPSAAPRRVVTGLDGRVDVKLRPGRYIIESDEPAVSAGRAFEWTQSVEVTAGADAVLSLNHSNATSVSATAQGDALASESGDLRTTLLQKWQDSVLEIWTPTAHASGILVDSAGLIVSSARAVGSASSVAVQLSPKVKVEARVLLSDAERGVSVLRMNGAISAGLTPMTTGCSEAQTPAVAASEKLFAISAPLWAAKSVSVGFVSDVAPGRATTDFRLPMGGPGGPVFNASRSLVGLTSVANATEDERPSIDVLPLDSICAALSSSEVSAGKSASEPAATLLPVEPSGPVAASVLDTMRRGKPGWPQTLQLSTADFDLSFITPLLLHAEKREYGAAGTSDRTRTGRVPVGATARPAPQRGFANWQDYVENLPPVLLVRATPRQVEGFWTTIARGAAMTQGVVLPPVKHFKPGFTRLQLFCDGKEVTPIHPFVIEQRVSETDAIREGLFIYDPAALGSCSVVTLTAYSEKDSGKADSKTLDLPSLQRLLTDMR